MQVKIFRKYQQRASIFVVLPISANTILKVLPDCKYFWSSHNRGSVNQNFFLSLNVVYFVSFFFIRQIIQQRRHNSRKGLKNSTASSFYQLFYLLKSRQSFYRVILYQLTKNSELLPVHHVDFLGKKKKHLKTSTKLTGPCKDYSCTPNHCLYFWSHFCDWLYLYPASSSAHFSLDLDVFS